MDRDEFLKRFEKKSTIQNYYKSFKKLDGFLLQQSITEEQLIEKLKTLEDFQRYDILQKLIYSIKETVSPRSTRNYFDNLFKYFLILGCPLDYTQKRIRLQFPRIIEKRFEGLDNSQIKRLFEIDSENFTGYMSLLVGGGLRETEGLLVTPSMIKWDEFPARVSMPGEITKFSVPRDTFIPPNTARRIKKIIQDKNISENQVIFTSKYTEKTLEDFEKYFAKIRKKAGLDTPNRAKHQQNDITLHSLRAFFITTFTNEGLSDFGHALAGHSANVSVYYRMSEEKRRQNYCKVMNSLEF